MHGLPLSCSQMRAQGAGTAAQQKLTEVQ